MRRPIRNIKEIRFNFIVPNMVTFAAAAAGLTSMRLVIDGRYDIALIAILLAAFFDGIDGRIARLMRGGSQFGVELDSLSDFLNFGVAPAFLLYMWSLFNFGGYGWVIALFLALCCELRLARFNVMVGDGNVAPYWKNFFMGMPAPAGGLVALIPPIIYMHTNDPIWGDPWLVAAFALFSGFMMASRIPTLSLKKVKIRAEYILPVFFIFILLLGLLLIKFWLVLGVMGIVYMAQIPVTSLWFLKLKKEYERDVKR